MPTPFAPAARKLSSSKGKPLPVRTIRQFGRQILQALCGLRAKGLVHHHLTCANVMIDEKKEVARVGGYENTLLGLPMVPQLADLCAPLLGSADADVLLFGHVLFEVRGACKRESVCVSVCMCV